MSAIISIESGFPHFSTHEFDAIRVIHYYGLNNLIAILLHDRFPVKSSAIAVMICC